MANRVAKIPEDLVERVLEKVDLVSLVEKVSQENMTQIGRGKYKSLCPLPNHVEETPSFVVSKSMSQGNHSNKDLYHCFGCKASGNAISLLRKVKGMSFIESIQYLSQEVGMWDEVKKHVVKESVSKSGFKRKINSPIKKDPKQQRDINAENIRRKTMPPKIKKERFLEINALAKSYYTSSLEKASDIKTYLKNRGISSQAIHQYGIGGLSDSKSFTDWMNKKGVSLQELVKSNIYREKKSGVYVNNDLILKLQKSGISLNKMIERKVIGRKKDRLTILDDKKFELFFNEKDVKLSELIEKKIVNSKKSQLLISSQTQFEKFLNDKKISKESLIKLGVCKFKKSNQWVVYNKLKFLDIIKQTKIPESELLQNASYKKFKKEAFFHGHYGHPLLIPLTDENKNVLGWNGRMIKDSKKTSFSKYLLSPNGSFFSKSSVLFGFDVWKDANTKNIILLEGVFDVLALYKDKPVALLGSSLNVENAKKIVSKVDNVTLFLDGDKAGLDAVFQVASSLYSASKQMNKKINVFFIKMPFGLDPAILNIKHQGKEEELKNFMKDNLVPISGKEVEIITKILKEEKTNEIGTGKQARYNKLINKVMDTINAAHKDKMDTDKNMEVLNFNKNIKSKEEVLQNNKKRGTNMVTSVENFDSFCEKHGKMIDEFLSKELGTNVSFLKERGEESVLNKSFYFKDALLKTMIVGLSEEEGKEFIVHSYEDKINLLAEKSQNEAMYRRFKTMPNSHFLKSIILLKAVEEKQGFSYDGQEAERFLTNNFEKVSDSLFSKYFSNYKEHELKFSSLYISLIRKVGGVTEKGVLNEESLQSIVKNDIQLTNQIKEVKTLAQNLNDSYSNLKGHVQEIISVTKKHQQKSVSENVVKEQNTNVSVHEQDKNKSMNTTMSV